MTQYSLSLRSSSNAYERWLRWVLSLLVLVITMVYVGLSVIQQQEDVRTDLEQRGQALAKGLAVIGGTAVLENLVGLRNAMQAKDWIQDVKSVVVLDKDYRVVAADNSGVIGQTLTNRTLMEVLARKTAVVLDGILVGEADTVVVVEPLFKDLKNSTGQIRSGGRDDQADAQELVGWIKVELSMSGARQGAIVLFMKHISVVCVLLVAALYLIHRTVRRLRHDLYTSEVRLGLAQRVAKIGNWEWDPVTDTVTTSSEFYRVIGVSVEGFPGTLQGFLEIVDPADRTMVEAKLRTMLSGQDLCDFDHRIRSADGGDRVVHLQAKVVRDEVEQRVAVIGTIQDISERKRSELEIHRLAYYDSLTRLPNRVLFKDRLTQALAHAKRHQTTLAVLFLDLDRFKVINDTWGHTVGDLLLEAVADRLTECVRGSDSIARGGKSEESSQLARLGGDEFTVLLTDLRSAQDATFVSRRIFDELAKPFLLDGREVFITASIGIAVFPTDGAAIDTLLKNADAAMYHAKEQGRHNYQFYSATMNALASERLAVESYLRKAVEREEIVVYYQPKVNLRTNRIVGAEALMRWNHPEQGLLSPNVFLPVAVETGLIRLIDQEVLAQACRTSVLWQKAGYTAIRFSVNVSNSFFHGSNVVKEIANELSETGLAPQYLELELTESITMQDAETSIAMLRELNALGIRLSMDDFGTGYSSLSYLRQFPLDQLKIDQSFIRGLEENPANASIIRAIIALAHSLSLTVLAEGVETEAQLRFLREHHCDEVQGYLLGRPMSSADFFQLLVREQARAA